MSKETMRNAAAGAAVLGAVLATPAEAEIVAVPKPSGNIAQDMVNAVPGMVREVLGHACQNDRYPRAEIIDLALSFAKIEGIPLHEGDANILQDYDNLREAMPYTAVMLDVLSARLTDVLEADPRYAPLQEQARGVDVDKSPAEAWKIVDRQGQIICGNQEELVEAAAGVARVTDALIVAEELEQAEPVIRDIRARPPQP